ncbi:MAG: sodium:calcium antiporter [Chloroflexota bacterium]
MTDVLILLVSLVVILFAAELFTNGIEWMGRKLGLGEGAVGSVLAAVGTALPETLIPIIAIIFATGEGAHEVGVGAILGAPFMLSTLAMFVTGVGVLAFRARRATGTTLAVDTGVLSHDLRYFFVGYTLAIGAAFLPSDLLIGRWIIAVILIGLYAWYVKGHLTGEASDHSADLAPLRMHRLDRNAHRLDPSDPRLRVIVVQVLASIGLIIVGAVFFIDGVNSLAHALGVSEVLLALVIAPIATELPEKFNSIIWVRQNKDTLALGNITGAMVFQSAIPTVVGLVFAADTWVVGEGSYVAFGSAALALIATAVIFIPARRRGGLDGKHLMIGGVFYLGYLLFVIGLITGVFGGGTVSDGTATA